MSVERIIGVDFGTTTSVIRVKRYDNGHPLDGRESKQEVIFNGDRPMVPTLIQRTDKGTYYGYDAMVSQKGQTLFRNFKVDLENPDPVRRQEARTLTEEFFVYMAKEYRSQSVNPSWQFRKFTEALWPLSSRPYISSDPVIRFAAVRDMP